MNWCNCVQVNQLPRCANKKRHRGRPDKSQARTVQFAGLDEIPSLSNDVVSQLYKLKGNCIHLTQLNSITKQIFLLWLMTQFVHFELKPKCAINPFAVLSPCSVDITAFPYHSRFHETRRPLYSDILFTAILSTLTMTT